MSAPLRQASEEPSTIGSNPLVGQELQPAAQASLGSTADSTCGAVQGPGEGGPGHAHKGDASDVDEGRPAPPQPASTGRGNEQPLDLVITVGHGRTARIGQSKRIGSVNELSEFLDSHTGDEAWWIPSEFTNAERTKQAWVSSSAIVLDMDFEGKATPDNAARRLFEVQAKELGATIFHHTPHGGRIVFVLPKRCTDAGSRELLARRLCSTAERAFGNTRYQVDQPASINPAQIMWAPRATVKGVAREFLVQACGGIWEGGMPQASTAPVTLRDSLIAPEDRPRSRPIDDRRKAEDAYRSRFPIETEIGDMRSLDEQAMNPSMKFGCPLCKHEDCVSDSIDAPNRAFCFSPNHKKDGGGYGRECNAGYLFDVIDIHAQRAGQSRVDFLRQNVWDQPGPLFEPLADVGVPQDRASARKIKLLTVAELAAMPRKPDLWERMMPIGSLAVWYGVPKCGKTYLAIAFGIAVAEAKPFLGRNTIIESLGPGPEAGDQQEQVSGRPRRGNVVYVVGEGIDGLRDKVSATIGPDRVNSPEDPFHSHFRILPNMPNLCSKVELAEVVQAIKELPVQPDLVIVDTVARALGKAGLDENSTKDMGSFVAALDALRESTGAAVLGIHHAGKSGMDRGSSSLRAAADMFAKVERVRPQVSRFVVEDQRNGDPAEPIDVAFEKRTVGLDASGPIERWYVERAKPSRRSALDAEEVEALSSQQSEVLDCLRRWTAAGGTVRRSDLQEELSVCKATVNRIIKALKEQGRVRQIGFGRNASYVESPQAQDLGVEAEAESGTLDSTQLGGLKPPSTSRLTRNRRKSG